MPKGSESYEGRRFITNGLQDKLISISDEIPNGWRYGRSTNQPTNPGCQVGKANGEWEGRKS